VRLYKDDTSIVEKYEEHREKRIVVAAYQFEVSDDINENYDNICKALIMAKMEENVQLIVFGECALSGYLGIDIESVDDIDYENLELCLENLGKLAHEYNIHILLGTITKHKETFYNSAVLLTTDRKRIYYAKRDLTRNEMDEIKPGEDVIIFAINGVKLGVRIGKELAMPEYFRELKDKNTDLNIVLSYGKENVNDMTKVYTRCRACENATYVLNISSVTDIKTTEASETCLVSDKGDVLVELEAYKEDMFVYELNIL
jgi:NAD+ synthase (glutamine-hydrolysing)